MTIRAKFFVQSITTQKAYTGPGLRGTVTLYAATPEGKIELGRTEEALKEFVIGEGFYVDFTPVPK